MKKMILRVAVLICLFFSINQVNAENPDPAPIPTAWLCCMTMDFNEQTGEPTGNSEVQIYYASPIRYDCSGTC